MAKLICLLTLLAACSVCAKQAWAREGHEFKIPVRSHLSLVQKLNRAGVEAVKKHDYEKAEALFYKAYLYDPADPFTLNNLGYVAEIQGQLDRAEKFYKLASEQGSDASIDKSNAAHLEGRPMKTAIIDLKDATMRVNRINVQAMRLLSEERGFEAVSLLGQALKIDPRNPFTLENLGVAYESIGDFEDALQYYREAAATHSSEPVVVTLDRSRRGSPVSATAETSAKRLEKRLQIGEPAASLAIMLTLRGVYEVNENNWQAAREDFLRAYSFDPASAFTLNNRGYVAEHDGDLETAQFYYEKARRAENASARVGLATDFSAQGRPLVSVAAESNGKVNTALDRYSEERRHTTGPIELTPRGGTPDGKVKPEEPKDTPSSPLPPDSH